MKHRSVFSRLLSLMLALLTAVSCLVAIPLTASAVEDLNAVSSFEPLDGPSWQIDLTKLPESSGPPNAVTVGDYSIHKGSKNLVFHTVTLDGEEETVLGVQNTCAALVISDVTMGLSSYEQFTFSTQLYFDEFPTGTRETSTADELPLSLLKWQAKKSGSTSLSDLTMLRVNTQGELCTANNSTSGTGVFLPLDRWFTLSVTYCPAEGFCAVSIDGVHVLQNTFTAVTEFTEPRFYLFDGYFQYTAYVKDPSVSTSDNVYWSATTNKWAVPTAVNSSLPDNVPDDHGDFSMSSSTIRLRKYTDPVNEKQKVWGFENTNGTFFFHDTENRLVKSAAFTMEADLYFDEFPSGTYSSTDPRTSTDYPLSLLKWRIKAPGAVNYDHHHGIRVNGNGELCTDANANSGTGVFLPTDRWFHLAITVNPSSGRYELYVDGVRELIGAFTPISETVSSDVGFLDGMFSYTAYLRDPSVRTLDEVNVGVTAESTADYFGYQARKNSDGTFDLRLLSAVDPAAFSASGAEASDLFATAGYEVTAVWEEYGEIKSNVQTLTSDSVFQSITAKNGAYSLPDGDYIHAAIISGIDLSLPRIELAVRPYTDLRDGTRRYGAAATLLWNGEYDTESGEPLLSRIEQTSPYKTTPTDDTYIRMSTKTTDSDTGVNGSKTTMYLKYEGDGNSYNRTGYLKFTLSDAGVARIDDACRILLRVYAYAVPTADSGLWTEKEIAAGGVLARFSGCDTDWDEATLSSTSHYPDSLPAADASHSFDVALVDDEWFTVDVTDYVKSVAKNGEIAFTVSLTEKKPGDSGDKAVQLHTSESLYIPELLVYPALFSHEVDLHKYDNLGYEPWGYAEKLVNEWVEEGYRNAYTAGDVQWRLDPNGMTSPSDNGNNAAISITANSNVSIVASPTNAGEKVLAISNNSSAYQIIDTNMALAKEDRFSVEADLYFASFPYGGKTTSDPTTANEYPMNLIRWMPTANSINYGIRVNADGKLCTDTGGSSATDVTLPKGKWFTLRLDVDRTAGTVKIYVDDELAVTRSGINFPTATISKIYLLDGIFKYTVSIKDLRVYGYDGYDTPDLEAVDNSQATGAYVTPIHWRASQMKGQINSKIYVRSIDSLSKLSTGAYDAASAVAPVYSTYGGITNADIRGTATGYFHTEILGGRTFIIDPLGYPYFAVGMNTVELGASETQRAASLAKYGTAENFYDTVSKELRDLGINTVWSGDWQQMMNTERVNTVVNVSLVSGYMASLKLTNSNSSVKFKHNNTMNVFDPDFITFSNRKAVTTVGDYANDPRILGWTTDNEIPASDNMLYEYLTVDASAPENAFSYAAAWTFLRARTGKANPAADDITEALSEEFKAFVYDRYYHVATGALEEAGAKQMYLGNRIHSSNKDSEGYLRAASQYVDVLTVNLYGGPEPPIDTVEYMYKYSGKPILVTEFYAKAQDANDMNGIPLMNQTNAGWVVETQEDRAAHYENYVLLLLESRCCVGWTWYRFRDNDQRIYRDADGNLYVDHDITGGAISSYVKVGTGTFDASGALLSVNIDPAFLAVQQNMDLSAEGDPYLPFKANITADQLTVVYKGESGGDNSNNGSNKGLYDNQMNIYQPLADAYARVDKHIMGLVNYFDALHAE